MSGKAHLKFLIFIIGMAFMVPAALVSLSLLTRFVTAFQQGADPASIFRGHSLVIPADEQARWDKSIEEDEDPTNPTQSEREEILAAYWLAWESLHRANLTGDLSDLTTYWAGAAYDQALSGIDLENRRSQRTSRHTLNLTFFSDDGSVAAFEDDSFIISHEINGDVLDLETSASVVMTLDQGFWRIRSLTLRYE